jgi:hypothetical protein
MQLIVTKAEAHKRTPNNMRDRLSKVYVWPEGETLMENLAERRNRPIKLYRTVLATALERAGCPETLAKQLAASARWSQKAGCGCGCSPGFRLDREVSVIKDGRAIYADFHVTVATAPPASAESAELVRAKGAAALERMVNAVPFTVTDESVDAMFHEAA